MADDKVAPEGFSWDEDSQMQDSAKAEYMQYSSESSTSRHYSTDSFVESPAACADMCPQMHYMAQTEEEIDEKGALPRPYSVKEREACLERYRQKRQRRKDSHFVRYVCRKKLADMRPRIKGRFASLKNFVELAEQAVAEGASVTVPACLLHTALPYLPAGAQVTDVEPKFVTTSTSGTGNMFAPLPRHDGDATHRRYFGDVTYRQRNGDGAATSESARHRSAQGPRHGGDVTQRQCSGDVTQQQYSGNVEARCGSSSQFAGGDVTRQQYLRDVALQRVSVAGPAHARRGSLSGIGHHDDDDNVNAHHLYCGSDVTHRRYGSAPLRHGDVARRHPAFCRSASDATPSPPASGHVGPPGPGDVTPTSAEMLPLSPLLRALDESDGRRSPLSPAWCSYGQFP